MLVHTNPTLSLAFFPNETEFKELLFGFGWEPDVLSQPSLLEVLEICENPISIDLVQTSLQNKFNFSSDTSVQLIHHLIEEKLLLTQTNYPWANWCKTSLEWHEKGWSDPHYFHLGTNALTKMDYTSDEKGLADKAMMRQFVEEESPPSAYKTNPSLPLIKLDRHCSWKIDTRSLEDVFLDQVGLQHNSQPWCFDSFSWFTHLAFGQTRTRVLPITGQHVAKTSPSGGSRHPAEVYLFIFEAIDERIPSGVYHYNVRDHGIEMLFEGNFSCFFREHIITHPSRPNFPFKIGIVFSCIFERSMFRYRESRSYRVMHYDLGHLMQNTALLASYLNRGSYRGYSLHDSDVEKLLGVDGISEAVMGFAAIE